VLESPLAVLHRGWEAVQGGDLDAAAGIAPEGAAAFGFRADRTKSAKVFPRPPGMPPAPARDRLGPFRRRALPGGGPEAVHLRVPARGRPGVPPGPGRARLPRRRVDHPRAEFPEPAG